MKTMRFHSMAVIFVVLMSSVYAQTANTARATEKAQAAAKAQAEVDAAAKAAEAAAAKAQAEADAAVKAAETAAAKAAAKAAAEADAAAKAAEAKPNSNFRGHCTDPAKGGGKLLYCGYASPLGCYKVQNEYPDVETGFTCAQKPSAKGCEPCKDKISACERDGTLYIGVNPAKLNVQPWGANVSCVKEGGIKIGGR